MNPFMQHEDLSKLYPATMIYIENSNLTPARNLKFQEKIAEFTQKQAQSSAKSYPLCANISLPSGPILKRGIERIIKNRRTRRTFSGKGIQTDTLARILHSAYGLTSKADLQANGMMFRACPSAGALYPLEIYPLVLRSKNLDIGVYHYNVKGHSLELLKEGDFYEKIESDVLGTELMPGADIVLIITSVLNRSMAKYDERGYRFILIEVGHMAQNISLICEALGLNSVCMGGFYENGIADLLSIDHKQELVQYVILLGTR